MKKLIIGVAIFALLVGLAAALALNTARGQDALFGLAAKTLMSQQPTEFDGLRVQVCGSASPLGNVPDRAQACIAVITPEHFFLFDIGARAPMRINQAQLPLQRLNGVFFTHYHSDHIAGLPDVNMASWVRGRKASLKVYGPLGVKQVVSGFNTAYQLDQGYRTAHHGATLLPPAAAPMTPVTIAADGIAWQDDNLTITAFTVEHPPIDPAVGYRIDYKDRSVVISGDTNATDNLFNVAQGADLLLHDALSRTLLDQMIEAAREQNVVIMTKIMQDVIDYHADSTTLPQRARDAGVRQLAFYHMVPAPGNALAQNMFLRSLPDDVILAADLQTFDFPADSTEIIISE